MIAPTHPSTKPCALDTVRRHEQRLRGRLLLLSPLCFVGQKHSQGTVRQAMHAATDSSNAAAPEFTSVLANFQPASKGDAHDVACVSVEVAKDQLLHSILELSRIQDGTGLTTGRRRVSMPVGCQTHPRMPSTRRLPRRSTTRRKTMARHEFNPACFRRCTIKNVQPRRKHRDEQKNSLHVFSYRPKPLALRPPVFYLHQSLSQPILDFKGPFGGFQKRKKRKKKILLNFLEGRGPIRASGPPHITTGLGMVCEKGWVRPGARDTGLETTRIPVTDLLWIFHQGIFWKKVLF